MTEGVVDNYLSKTEEEYFTSHGNKNIDEITESAQESPEVVEHSHQDSNAETSEESETRDVDQRDDKILRGVTDNSESDDEESETSDIDSPEKTRDFEKAFKVERHKRKEMREALEAQARKTSEMENMLAQLQEASKRQEQLRQEANAPKEVVPDPEEDPIGYQQYKINKLESALNEQTNYLRQQYEVNQRSQAENAFRIQYESQAKTFMNQNPEFKDAYNFLMSSRMEEHMAAGFSKEQAQQLLIEDEMAVVAQAFKDRVNPAERIFNISRARGFTATKSAPKKNIDSLKKGLDNSKSLRSGGGEPPEKAHGMDQIDEMDWSEFDSLFNKIKAQQKGIR